MSKRNLLLCFDAFGTLFTPKRPIAQQYGEVARALGLSGFTDEQVHASFKDAFKREAKESPNFGKANGSNAARWWTNIIHNTFSPLIEPTTKLPEDLAPRLIYRFSSEEAYELRPGVLALLQDLRTHPPRGVDRIAVGVITNSDDRVPNVLTCLGLRVSPLTFDKGASMTTPPRGEQYDVDFTVMSYDVGCEKPDAQIFKAAEDLLGTLPVAEGAEASSWEKVHVGDEYDKDVVGARNAGWSSVLLEEQAASQSDRSDVDELASGDLLRKLRASRCDASFSSFGALARALGVDGSGRHGS
ncbi:hypothetical protein LTR53_001883 [Teratosphaeriaceae sp. CCFEE 6253]|nr:hypothetical protein LTR53_001883 [Teratosphaeriaceae sp. CCFEE 6253]